MNRDEWKATFGENLDYMLKERQMTRGELAEKSGLTKAAISNYILGKRMPTLEAALAIAYALDCSMDDLVDLDGPIEK